MGRTEAAPGIGITDASGAKLGKAACTAQHWPRNLALNTASACSRVSSRNEAEWLTEPGHLIKERSVHCAVLALIELFVNSEFSKKLP